MKLDLCFPVTGTQPLAADHAYHLYGAVSRVLPVVHENPDIGVHPIKGRQVGNRQMSLMPWSELRLRTPQEHVIDLLPLAGHELTLGGADIQLQIPKVLQLKPLTALRSRLVTIKLREGRVTTEGFEDAVRRQLENLEVSSQVTLTVGKQRTVQIKRREIIGFEVLLEGLNAEESIAVQEHGLGGRRGLGCGLFLPVTFAGEV